MHNCVIYVGCQLSCSDLRSTVMNVRCLRHSDIAHVYCTGPGARVTEAAILQVTKDRASTYFFFAQDQELLCVVHRVTEGAMTLRCNHTPLTSRS